jgi:hypothetical protein
MSIASLYFIGGNYSNTFFINDLDGASKTLKQQE